MDLHVLRVFVRVATLGSFTRTSEQLRMPKSRVSSAVRTLEERVGCKLLQRTTRAVRLTAEGALFLPRAQALTQAAEELGSMFSDRGGLSGTVRVDLPLIMARDVIMPRLPDFLAAHPGLELVVSSTDRRVDALREGFDCVLRVGSLREQGLTARRLGTLPMMNCASNRYLQVHGIPRTLEDLGRHLVVHYSQGLGAEPPSFEYMDGNTLREVPMRSRITVNNSDAYVAACRAGLGIIQVPRMGKGALLDQGQLVEVLPDHTGQPMPVSLIHVYERSVPSACAQ